MTWTAFDKKLLTALWDAGATASEIAVELGVTRDAVIGKAHRLKLPARRKARIAWTDEDLATLVALWPTPIITQHVAEHLRRSVGACRAKATDLGIYRVTP